MARNRKHDPLVSQVNPDIYAALIYRGIVFSTPHESGCVALHGADDLGNFAALDSDGVRCGFSIAMVASIDGVRG